MKEVLSDATDAASVLVSFKHVKPGHTFKIARHRYDGLEIEMSEYCSRRSGSGAATLKPAIISKLMPILGVSGRMFLEIVDRDDGTSLILAKYDQLIADRWLAIVSTESVDRMIRGRP